MMIWQNISFDEFDFNSTYSLYDYNYSDAILLNDTLELQVKKKLYPYVLVIMLLFCIFSVAINVIILCSTCWIRRPLSPTLHISLSLAGSDMYTSLVLGTGLVLNSLLPSVFNINIQSCMLLFLEALRMGGMFTTIGHLLALAGNHYLGIRKPLRYPSIMTNRNISIAAFMLWVTPTGVFLTYFNLLENDGFNHPGCANKFIQQSRFRRSCSYVFVGCLVIMASIYSHIYLLVRKHQANRNRFRRVGSTYSRKTQAQENNMIRSHNEKALRTTLLIVVSVVVGWLPATLHFTLVCNDCPIHPKWGTMEIRVMTGFLVNSLILAKTALNSYIYAARMHEIKAQENNMIRSHNEKALRTTLLIVVSVVVGWLYHDAPKY